MNLKILENRYQVIRVLGSGGFGETFLAEDTHLPSGRRCVVKQLKPQTNDPRVYQLVKERFQREAVILEDLGQRSNQIPSLYAYFESDNQFYLVQEYIEGVTLGKLLQDGGTLSDSSVKEILTGILPVLEYVHSQRIVHRDIKPDNIILRNLDNQPVLIDFGAVKETMGTTVSVSGNSSRSIVIGTPGFMPYEQTAGRPVFASDLYSLGLTAIYLLTGKFPQELETDPQTGEILWRRYALSVSPTLAGVLDKAIQFHSRDRYSTPREMLDALRIVTTQTPSPTPTIISPPPIGVINQPTTVISANPAPQSFPPQPTHSTVAARGLTDWQKAVISGGVIGVFVLGALVLTRPQTSDSSPDEVKSSPQQPIAAESPPSQPQVNPPPVQPSVSNNPPPVQSPPSNNSPPVQPPQPPVSTYNPPAAKISQQEAVGVIQQWLQAKRELFAPPFNRQLGSDLLTGKAYSDNIRKTDGTESSVDWLENNNAYYSYGVQRINNVNQFAASGDQATIEVVVTEERTLYKDGRVDRENTKLDTSVVRYSLQLDNGNWKIADYKTVR